MNKNTYASAGVDVGKAESFVERLKAKAKRPAHGKLWQGAGGYASVYPISSEQAVALTTDGVGTKLLVACQLGKHETIGIDLVAMCANDLICVGARPSAFLDYYATGKLDDNQADALVSGILAGCDQAGMILAGGETAEMPDLYSQNHYDIAGFAIGEVSRKRLLTGESIIPGQKLIGIASSGIHSNGLSLARKVLAGNKTYFEQLITPTSIYVMPINKLLDANIGPITGIAHITGGGWRNLLRLNSSVGYHINNPLPVPPIFHEIAKSVNQEEMYKTFNMGMGLCLIVGEDSDTVIRVINDAGFQAQEVGYVTDKPKQLAIEQPNLIYLD